MLDAGVPAPLASQTPRNEKRLEQERKDTTRGMRGKLQRERPRSRSLLAAQSVFILVFMVIIEAVDRQFEHTDNVPRTWQQLKRQHRT